MGIVCLGAEDMRQSIVFVHSCLYLNSTCIEYDDCQQGDAPQRSNHWLTSLAGQEAVASYQDPKGVALGVAVEPAVLRSNQSSPNAA